MGFKVDFHEFYAWMRQPLGLGIIILHPIPEPEQKIGVQQLIVVRKPNFMGFKVGFHGFHVYKLWLK